MKFVTQSIVRKRFLLAFEDYETLCKFYPLTAINIYFGMVRIIVISVVFLNAILFFLSEICFPITNNMKMKKP